MNKTKPNVDDQLEKNRKAYEAVRSRLESKEPGRVALLHDGEMVAVYNDSGDAYDIGCERYGLGNFSIQKIGEPPVSLGIFTMCVPTSTQGV
ncbi:MAG: hypothetical protein OXG03_06595 [Gammaproteobacteria bacterium]|nr:hypothetical protein [Gammaproteobacteria bacterium]